MEGLVKEYVNFLNDDKKPASEKFWELEKRIKEDKRHPGVVMELKKSELIWDIVRLIRLKVITYNDLSDLPACFIYTIYFCVCQVKTSINVFIK